MYLVKCRIDESEKALTNAISLAEESQCMSEGIPFFLVYNVGKNRCNCHHDLSCTGK